jgi:protein-L-isoaspartate O-methyltransferase
MNPKYTKDENGKDLLTITEKEDQVMMEWEKPYMEACIEKLNPSGHVLEIGFGLGYSATAIQNYSGVKKHTIIECSPEVWP